MRSPEFWQRILAAELAPAKNRVLLKELGSFATDPISALLASPLLSDVEKKRIESVGVSTLNEVLEQGASILEYDEYPELLHESGNVSPALFVKGSPKCLFGPTVAIVGTRSASLYGRACAYKFGQALGKAGVTVISGGALGIDAAAHKGAMEAGGATAAVLATGLDQIYPRIHRSLFDQISKMGCLVTQFAVGSRLSDFKFLIRNVLIASLSDAVIVIEAPAKSGALSTATAANELGREVFVVPANIDSQGFFGSFGLLRDGATLITHPDQVLESLNIEPSEPEPESEPTTSGGQILAVLTSNPISTEKIVELTGLEPSEVLSEITILEIEGRVIRGTGGYALRP